MTTITRTIAGQPVALEAGQRYRATRPIASKYRVKFPVKIYPEGKSGEDFATVIGHDFTIGQANEALAELYAGVTEGLYFTWQLPEYGPCRICKKQTRYIPGYGSGDLCIECWAELHGEEH